MRDELRLLLACARTRHSETNASTIRHILAGHIDWTLFARNAAEHGLVGLVGHSLDQTAPNMVPEDIRAAFRTNLDETRNANRRAMEGIHELLDVLANAGLRAIPFNGPLLGVQAYKDPGFRAFRESEFLIRDSDMTHIVRILHGLGYRQAGQLTPEQRRALNRIDGEEIVFHPEQGNSISLCTRLTPLKMVIEPDYAGSWARALACDVNQQPTLTLSREDLFQSLALRGATRMWRSIGPASDIAALIESGSEVDWAALLKRARAQGCLRAVLLAAGLAGEVFGADLPPAVAEAAAHKSQWIKLSIARIVGRWEQGHEREKNVDTGRSLDRLRLHDNFQRRVRHIIRTVFLPNRYHISRIALPGGISSMFVYGASKFIPYRVMIPVSRCFLTLRRAAAGLFSASIRFRKRANRTSDGTDAAYDCYVISLARLPHKYPDFLATNGPTGLDFRRFEGVDGKTLTFAEAINMGVIRPNTTGYTEGMIGCAASHLQLWRQAKDRGKTLLIFEDDAYCRWDIRHHLHELLGNIGDWDIILLGYNTSSILDVKITSDCHFAGFFSNQNPTPAQLSSFQKTTDSVALMRLNNAFGSCAYLVSPTGAEKLIDTFPMDNRPVLIPGLQMIKSGRTSFRCVSGDMVMNTVYRDINAYAVVPPLVIPLHDHATSTTHGPGDPN